MKGIKLCGECADYDIKKHRCKRGASREDDARNTFYDDCPLPDVAPVVHGKWIVNSKREYDYICSVCGGDAPENRWANNDMLTSYCPNCGAKMDGGK